MDLTSPVVAAGELEGSDLLLLRLRKGYRHALYPLYPLSELSVQIGSWLNSCPRTPEPLLSFKIGILISILKRASQKSRKEAWLESHQIRP